MNGGKIDDTNPFDKALTAEEVAALYADPYALLRRGLVGAWMLNEPKE